MQTIFIVDDNKAFRELLKELLIRAGFRVEEAENGEDAIQAIRDRKFKIHLMMLDLLMPKKDGFVVLNVLSRLGEQGSFPVLVMSGFFKSMKDIERVRKLGALGFIDKTMNIEEILYRINQILNPVNENLRASRRTAITLLVQYRLEGKSGTAYTFNISEGGLFIRLMNPPELKTKIQLRFSLPNSGELIKADGEVAWRNEYNPTAPKLYPPGIGVQFINMNVKDGKIIKDFVRELEQKTDWQKPAKN